MMEFMFARVSMCLCAALIICMLFTPVTDSLMEDADDLAGNNCRALGEAVDRFISGEASEAILSLDMYLPDSGTMISFRGDLLTFEYSDKMHCYRLREQVKSDYEFYGTTDVIRLTNDNGEVHIGTV